MFKHRTSPTFSRANILVLSSDFGLRTGSPEGLRQPLGLLQARGESYAAHRAILLIGAPSGSSDVPSYNALDWKYVEVFDHHAPAL